MYDSFTDFCEERGYPKRKLKNQSEAGDKIARFFEKTLGDNHMVDAYPGDELFSKLLQILASHCHRDEKVRNGVSKFRLYRGQGIQFVVFDNDGNDSKVSWRKIGTVVSGGELSKTQRLYRVLRNSCVDCIHFFRNTMMDEDGEGQCSRCEGWTTDAEVDHFKEDFVVLADGRLRKQKRIVVRDLPRGGEELADPTDWLIEHELGTQLRMLCRGCHKRRKKQRSSLGDYAEQIEIVKN